MERKARMTKQPTMDLRRLMRGVVVDDDVDIETLRHGSVDQVQKPPELIGSVSIGEIGDDLSARDVQGGIEVRRAMADVVVTLTFGNCERSSKPGARDHRKQVHGGWLSVCLRSVR